MDEIEIKILEYSFRGDHDERSLAALQVVLRKTAYDLVSVRGISYRALKHLEPTLLEMGYNMYIDPTWRSVTAKWRYTCLSVLYVKNSIAFSQIAGSFGFDTVLRYVCGKFEFGNHSIFYRTSHIPSVDDTRSQLSWQIERKENMLRAEIEYQNEHMSDCSISAGDFNGSADDEDCYCQDLYGEFVFRDLMISESTYEDKQSDHVYISDGFENAGISVEAEVLDKYCMQPTDHKMIAITLKRADCE